MATPEQLQAIRDELRREIRAEFHGEAAAAAAHIPDAIKRKPEIPPFDKKHIDNWIRRTENAFIRALCQTPREKFAFLETKFPVDFNPRINEYLWGEATEAKWTEFLNYLRAEYGMTKQQRAAVILDGFKRDGKKPSQYAALLDEKTKDLTIEDIKKEMLIREMPADIQRMLQERINNLSFKDAAKTADAYFDQDGRPRHTTMATAVNAVQETATEPVESTSDDSENINAVGRQFNNSRFPGPRNTGNQRDKPFGQNPRRQQPWTPPHKQLPPPLPRNTNQRTHTGAPTVKPAKLCRWHVSYGDKAYTCEEGCDKFSQHKSGNAKAGRRT